MSGYEALRTSAAWIDLSDRGKIRATGEDRARPLHAMTTNNISALEQGQGNYNFFLNAQGRILADANIYNLGESLFLDTEPELREKLLQHLDRYIIADDVALADETAGWAAFGVEGPTSENALRGLEIPVPEEPLNILPWNDGFVARASATGSTGWRIFVPIAQKEAVAGALQAAGITKASADEARIVRIENGKPRYGEDITERFLTQETEQMQAVSFAKGCYLGQEIVERVRSRAQIHRKLSPVRIRSTQAPPPGAKLTAEGKPAGEITSAVFSPALNEIAALAYVRVEQLHAKPDMTVDEFAPEATAYIPA